MGSLTGVYHLAVHGDETAFEEAMTQDVMPSVTVLSRGVRGVRQELVKLHRETGAPQYRWFVTLEHFGDDASESVGSAIPGLFSGVLEQVADRLATHVVHVGFEMTIPVAASHASAPESDDTHQPPE